MARDIYEIKPTSDWKDPATPHGGKKRRVYTSGTMYQAETGRYASPGMSGTQDAMGHGTKKVVDTGSWNHKTVQRGDVKVPGAQRGVGQETIDGFINAKRDAIAAFIKKAAADKYKPPRRRDT